MTFVSYFLWSLNRNDFLFLRFGTLKLKKTIESLPIDSLNNLYYICAGSSLFPLEYLRRCRSGLVTNSIFFCFLFLWSSLICLEGKSMTPLRGNAILFRSSQQLPRLRLRPSKGFLSWHGALLGPSTRLVRCFRNYRDTRTPSGVAR